MGEGEGSKMVKNCLRLNGWYLMSCANLSATDSTFITQDVISSARIFARYQACHVTYRLRISSIMESFYIVKNELSFIMSKSSTKNLCNENLMCPENWHFNSRFVLKTTNTLVFVFITEIFDNFLT